MWRVTHRSNDICVLSRLSNDLLSLIYKELHRDTLLRCFKDISISMEWDDELQILVSVPNSVRSMFNYREFDERKCLRPIYKINIRYGTVRAYWCGLPSKYWFSSGLNCITGFKEV